MSEYGGAIFGTPEDALERIARLQKLSGGFGTILSFAHDWATRPQMMRSYELLARYVMPRCQGLIAPIEASAARVTANKAEADGKSRRRNPESNPRLQRGASQAEVAVDTRPEEHRWSNSIT